MEPVQRPQTQTPVTPLRPRTKSHSTDRLRYGTSSESLRGGAGGGDGKFVDPLVLRRKEARGKSGVVVPTPVVPGKKVAVGQLVAFFDEKRV